MKFAPSPRTDPVGNLGEAAEPHVPALAELLGDEGALVRKAAANSLQKLGAHASGAADTLENYLKRGSKDAPVGRRHSKEAVAVAKDLQIEEA